MSATRTITIRCDNEGCVNWEYGASSRRATVDDARMFLIRKGWSRKKVGGKYLDLCPECRRKLDRRCSRNKEQIGGKKA